MGYHDLEDEVTTLKLSSRFGDAIQEAIEKATGVPVEIILLAFPVVNDGTRITTPTFVTSLAPEDMERTLIAVGSYIQTAGDPIIVRDGPDD